MSKSPNRGKSSAAGSGRTTRRTATEDKLDRLLSAAAVLMARKGFSQTSIRDVSRATGFSLAGMYYYFKSKDDLLFLIQQRTFTSLVETQEAALAQGGSPEERLRRLVHGHLAFYTTHSDELKVCTFELESLSGETYHEVEEVRRRYYRLTAALIAEVLGRPQREGRLDLVVRHVTLYIFGMLNWVFMWYDPDLDTSMESMADEMADLLLHGVERMSPA